MDVEYYKKSLTRRLLNKREVIRDGFVQDTWNANLERARVIPSHYNSTRLVCGMLSSVGEQPEN